MTQSPKYLRPVKYSLLAALLFLTISTLEAQDPDSLRRAFRNPALTDSTRLSNVHGLARYFLYRDPDSSLYYAGIQKAFAQDVQDTSFLGAGYNIEGGAYMVMGRFVEALDRFARSLDLKKAIRDTIGMAAAYNNIGNVYYYQGDYPRALKYFVASSELEEMIGNRKGLAASKLNIGSIYGEQKEPARALENFHRALQIYRSLGDSTGMGNSCVNVGAAYMALDSFDAARTYLEQGVDFLQNTTANNNVIVAYGDLARIHLEEGNPERAFSYFQLCEDMLESTSDRLQLAKLYISRGGAHLKLRRYNRARDDCSGALGIAEQIGALPEMQDACECLYHAHKGLGQNERALTFFERSVALNDSLARDETRTQLQIMEFRQQVASDSIEREQEKRVVEAEHARQVERMNRRRNVYVAMGLALLVLSVVLYRTVRRTQRSMRQIEGEKSRTDKLLLSVLPEPVANELLTTGKVDAREFEGVTVLFTDFVGFTEAVKDVPGMVLVNELNEIFRAFDEIVARHGIQKIKTVGDAYMAAGGLPVSSTETVKRTVDAALEMQTFIEHYRTTRSGSANPTFHMRAGVHKGPVTAGIVGQHNFQFDIWGTTVNIASRLETHSTQGRVNISREIYDVIAADPHYRFVARGRQAVKGAGEMEMWFVERT